MNVHCVHTPQELGAVEAYVRAHPNGSLWQSSVWATYRHAIGRQTRTYVCLDGGVMRGCAQVVIDTTFGGLETWDCPRGPLWDASVPKAAQALLHALRQDAKKARCMVLTYSPSTPSPCSEQSLRIRPSDRHEQPVATRIIDLQPEESSILAQMKQKGRYNIRVAERKEVRVETSNDMDAYLQLARNTASRDGFALPAASHMHAFLEHVQGSTLLLAYIPPKKEPIAGLVYVQWGSTGLYYYGASNHAYREYMAPYALQWVAMQQCKQAGCTTYDLLGTAPSHAGSDHPWYGITRFKEQFGGTEVLYPPESMMLLRPATYNLLKLKRRIMG